MAIFICVLNLYTVYICACVVCGNDTVQLVAMSKFIYCQIAKEKHNEHKKTRADIMAKGHKGPSRVSMQ